MQPHLAMALNTGLATIAGEHGRTDEARALLDQVVADGPFANGNDLMATLHAMHIAEAAVAIEHVEAAATRSSGILDAHTGLIGLLATGHLCFGAIDRARGRRRSDAGPPRRRDRVLRAGDRHRGGVGARIYANRSRLGLAIRAGHARRRR